MGYGHPIRQCELNSDVFMDEIMDFLFLCWNYLFYYVENWGRDTPYTHRNALMNPSNLEYEMYKPNWCVHLAALFKKCAKSRTRQHVGCSHENCRIYAKTRLSSSQLSNGSRCIDFVEQIRGCTGCRIGQLILGVHGLWFLVYQVRGLIGSLPNIINY